MKWTTNLSRSSWSCLFFLVFNKTLKHITGDVPSASGLDVYTHAHTFVPYSFGQIGAVQMLTHLPRSQAARVQTRLCARPSPPTAARICESFAPGRRYVTTTWRSEGGLQREKFHGTQLVLIEHRVRLCDLFYFHHSALLL